MRRIYLDVTRLLKGIFLRRRPTGVDRVSLAYVRHYGGNAHAVLAGRGHHIVMSRRASSQIFDAIQRHYEADRPVGKRELARILLPGLRFRMASGGVLLHTSHSGAEFSRYFESLKVRGVHVVFMVHDLIPLTHAEYCRVGTAQIHDQRIRSALSTSSAVIANSQTTLDDMFRYAARHQLNMPRCIASRLAPGTQTDGDTSRPMLEPYFVMVGTIEPRKNHWLIFHVWRRIAESLVEDAPRLVVIGRQGWKCGNALDMLEDCVALRHLVIWQSDCSDYMLGTWLKHAKALLFPSFTEGYGMPVAEALACGVPVIASDLAALREYAGDVPDYLDPLDGPAWHARILAYINDDSPERAQQLARITGFRAPTWEEHFEQVDGLLVELDT